MEEVASKITNVESKLQVIETLQEKEFSEWTTKEKNKYGWDESEARQQLMKKKMQLMKEELQLIEQQNLLLKIQLQGGTSSARDLRQGVPMEIDRRNGTQGKLVDLINPQALMNFMNTQMDDKSKLFTSCRILSENQRDIKMSGREAAINKAAERFKVFAEPVGKRKEVRSLPVASGLSGLGKTRLLEEFESIFDKAGIIGPRFGVLVPYYNGYNPQPVEKSMGIEASFSWRLLYRVFLDGNGLDFSDWFEQNLPVNGAGLTLHSALEVIRMKAQSLGLIKEIDVFHLFLGVDEYQSIEDVNGIPVKNEPLLQDLISAIGDIVADPIKNVRIYPMFAGTNFSVISIVSSTTPGIMRLPMSLLIDAEMEQSIESIPCGLDLLKQAAVRRHLFFLGGVPRWFTEYVLLLVAKVSQRVDKVPTVEEAEEAFKTVKSQYIDEWGKVKEDRKYKALEPIDFIKLAAYAFAGVKVVLQCKQIGNFSWARLRDSSICVIDEDNRISVPYAIIRKIAYVNENQFSGAVKCFIKCLKGLFEKVDRSVYEKSPWQLWEVFGAYFHALRINALLIIGKNIVKVSELFKGALINGCSQEVKLRPMIVMETEDKLSPQLESTIRRKGHSKKIHDYLQEGLVVLNGENGKGVDIFFALESTDGQYVCINDQRKYDATPLAKKSISGLLSLATIKPNISNVFVIPCLFSCSGFPKVQAADLVKADAIVVTCPQSKAYHGSMWIHPASSPLINVNNTSITHLKNLFSGADAAKAAKMIIAKKRNYESIEDLDEDLQELQLGVCIREEEKERISFA